MLCSAEPRAWLNPIAIYNATLSTPISKCHSYRMVLQLPDDLLRYISDFAQSASFSRTCHKAFRALHGRHLHCQVSAEDISAMLGTLCRGVAFRTLTLQCHRTGDSSAEARLPSRMHPP